VKEDLTVKDLNEQLQNLNTTVLKIKADNYDTIAKEIDPLWDALEKFGKTVTLTQPKLKWYGLGSLVLLVERILQCKNVHGNTKRDIQTKWLGEITAIRDVRNATKHGYCTPKKNALIATIEFSQILIDWTVQRKAESSSEDEPQHTQNVKITKVGDQKKGTDKQKVGKIENQLPKPVVVTDQHPIHTAGQNHAFGKPKKNNNNNITNNTTNTFPNNKNNKIPKIPTQKLVNNSTEWFTNSNDSNRFTENNITIPNNNRIPKKTPCRSQIRGVNNFVPQVFIPTEEW